MVFNKHSITNIVAAVRRKNTPGGDSQRMVIIDTARPFMRGTFKVTDIWQLTPARVSAFDEIVAKAIITGPDSTTTTPLDVALSEYTHAQGIALGRHLAMTVIPFSESLAMSGNIWHHGTVYHLFVKGAPEQVLLHCDLTENEREKATMTFHKLTNRGHSVIAVAHTELGQPVTHFGELSKKQRLALDGFVILTDSFSTGAKQAVSQALANKVTIIMLTGEHSETAYHSARKLGIITAREQVSDSRHIHTMSDDELLGQLHTTRVFARASLADKQRIVTLIENK